ncbi:TatD family hydrolase [Bacillus marinisedimentorum]|uniref:TatD family hydrolase n=1 Tax=Bacillus marinisedimentorum TaxID=1821260 RepID=UPI0008724ABC|nr:TatD family hydrolase [Bacillus marinisedimentorum]
MYDAHIHLDKYEDGDIPASIERWKAAGVKGVVAVSTDLPSSYKTLELKEKFPDFIKAAVGFHPEYELPAEGEILEWQTLLKKERELISAAGEIGLPYYERERLGISSLDPYIEVFAEYVRTARAHDLPVVLHAVHETALPAFEVLQKERHFRAHFHWHKAPKEVTEKLIEAGYFISVTPEVCWRERDRMLTAHVPSDRLLLETDGPWPLGGLFEGKRNSPLLLEKSAAAIAEIKNISIKEIKQVTAKNTEKIYGKQ